MRYEKALPELSQDEAGFEALLQELYDIRTRLEHTVGIEKGLIYAELISHIKKVSDYLARKYPDIRKRMEAITVGGQVYETLTEQHIKQGIEIGLEQGLEKGLEQGLEQGLEKGLEQGLEQGLEKGLEQGLKQGQLDTLLSLVKDGLLTITEAAKWAKLSTTEFKEHLNKV